MEKILSIIVPSYNMEKYLQKGLDSLIISKKALEKIEIIVINDGSKDNTLKIAVSFKNKYPDVFQIIDKRNGNYGSCINTGLKAVRGRYVKILDADDFFDTENFEKLVYEIEKSIHDEENVDLFFTDFHIVDDKYNFIRLIKKKNLLDGSIVDIREDKDVIYFLDIQHHGIIYRTANLREMCYCQTEGISYTDQEWITIPLFNIKRIKYLSIDVYGYLLGRDGQTMSSDIILKDCKSHVIVAENMLKEYETKKEFYSKVNSYIVRARLLEYLRYIYRMYIVDYSSNESTELIEELDSRLKDNDISIYKDLGETKYSKKIQIKYIKYFRSNRTSVVINILKNFNLLKK